MTPLPWLGKVLETNETEVGAVMLLRRRRRPRTVATPSFSNFATYLLANSCRDERETV
jgi:hypothetical protein